MKPQTLESDQELIDITPDLVDFFNLVDVNGDGEMQWSEFVMFVIGETKSLSLRVLLCRPSR